MYRVAHLMIAAFKNPPTSATGICAVIQHMEQYLPSSATLCKSGIVWTSADDTWHTPVLRRKPNVSSFWSLDLSADDSRMIPQKLL